MAISRNACLSSPPSPSAGTRPLLLLVEDDPRMRRFLDVTFAQHGYRVVTADDGAGALAQASSHNPDLVLLDLGLPDMDGIEVATRLRDRSSVPILVLSARARVQDKVTVLDAGANDFVTKPFAMGELLARMRVWLRQPAASARERAPAVKEIGELRFDFERRLAFVRGEEIHLTPTEYQLLALLVTHAGKVMTHGQILKAVWGPSYVNEVQYLRVYMGHLRGKIESVPARPRYLVTETGVGYRLRTD